MGKGIPSLDREHIAYPDDDDCGKRDGFIMTHASRLCICHIFDVSAKFKSRRIRWIVRSNAKGNGHLDGLET